MRTLPRPSSPAALVTSFALSLESLRTQLAAELALDSGLQALIAAVRAELLPPSGRLSSGLEYHVVGESCCLVDPSGMVVEVELLRDGRAVFDVPRLVDYAKSIGAHHLDDYLLANACDVLVDMGVIHPIRLGRDPAIVDLADESPGVVIDLRRADTSGAVPLAAPRAVPPSGFDDHP